MKNTTMISLVAGIGLVAGPLSATASGFGGGWAHNPGSGTLYNSNAPTVEQQQTTVSKATYQNSFGGGWAHNPSSGTLYNSSAPTVAKQDSSVASNTKAESSNNHFGAGWTIGSSGTLTYDPS